MKEIKKEESNKQSVQDLNIRYFEILKVNIVSNFLNCFT